MAARKNNKKRLSEVAYDQIKEMIIANVYRQGTMLSEKQLCATLNMSRTPVREAIHMLETEGLLEVRDGVGTFVREQSQKDIEDVYEVRRSLEILSIQTSMNHFTEEELNELETLFRDIQKRYKEHAYLSTEEYAEADWKLHDMIVQKSDNKYVNIVMESIRSSMKRFQQLSVWEIAGTDKSLEEHFQIIDGIRRKDKERLIQVLEEHIRY